MVQQLSNNIRTQLHYTKNPKVMDLTTKSLLLFMDFRIANNSVTN